MENSETPVVSAPNCCPDKKKCLLCGIVAVVALLFVATLTFFLSKQLGLKQVPLCSPCPACERCGQSLNQSPIATSPSPTTTTAVTDPTAGWKTYTEANLYSFRYPANANIDNFQETIRIRVYPLGQKVGSEMQEGVLIFFKIVKIPLTNLATYVDSEIAKSEGIKYRNIRASTINTYNAYSYTAEGLGTSRTFYIQHPVNLNTIVEMFDASQDRTDQGYEKVANQILSTFKFTD